MTDAIQESHRHHLGCSELAAAIGVNPYKTPYRLFEEKTALAEPEDLSKVFRVAMGHHLEPLVAKLWTERTGLKLRRRNRPIYYGEGQWLVAHLDREVVGKKEVWEGKTALGMFRSDEWGEEGTDQVPLHYIVQCLGYLAVTGAERCHLAALLAGPELRHYVIERDEDAIQDVMGRANWFWTHHVQTGIPPAITTLEDAGRRWRQSTEGAVIADNSDLDLVAEWRDVAHQIKQAEDHLDRLKLRMAERLQDRDTLIDSTGSKLLTWKAQSTSRLNNKLLKERQPEIYASYSYTSASRVFRLAKDRTK